MVDAPDPRHYGTLAEWIEAARLHRRLKKKDLARLTGASPQAVSKWYKGAVPDTKYLVKLAVWGGAEYAHLVMLGDKVPIPGARRTREGAAHNPDVLRLMRKLEVLAGDEDSIGDIESLIDRKIEVLAKSRTRRKVGNT